MAANIKGISIEFGGEVTGLGKALADVDSKARSVQSELKQVEKLLKLDPSDTQLVAQKHALLKEAVANTTEKLERLKAAQAQVQAQFDKGEITQEQYRAFQREIQKTEQELKSLETAGKKSMAEIGKGLDDAGQKMTNAGRSLTQNVTAPIIAAGAAGVVMATDIDDALDKIRIKTGATGKEFKKLQDDFRATAKQVPNNFDEISTAIADLNVRLGLTGPPLQDMAVQILNLSRLTGTDLATNINDITRLFGDWSIPTENQTEAMDALFRVTQEAGIGLNELTETVVQFGAPLRGLGFTFEESITILGKWQKEGVNIENVFGAMKKAYGSFASEFGEKAPEMFRKFVDEISKAPDRATAAAMAIEKLGVKNGPDFAAACVEGRFAYGDLMDKVVNGKETINKAAADTEDWLEKLKKLWNHLKVELQPALDKIWDALNKLVPVIAKIGDKIVGLVKSFSDLPSGVQAGVFAFIGFLAALGPVLMIAGTLVSSIGKIVGAFSAASAAIAGAGGIMAVLTGPWGIAIAVVAALAAAAFLIYKNWAKIKEAVQPVVEMFKTYVVPVLQEVWAVIKGSLVAALDNLKQAWGNLLPVLQPLLPYLKMIGVAFLIAIVAPIAIAIAAILAVIVVFSKLVEGITWVVAQVAYFANNWKTVFKDAIDAVIAWFSDLPTKIGEFMGTVARWIVDSLTSAKDQGISAISAFIQGAIDFFSNLPGQIASFLSGLPGTIASAFRSAAEWAQNALYSIVEYAFGLPGRLYDAAARMGQALWDGIKGFFKDIAEGFQKAFRGESSPGFVEVFKGELDKVSSLYDGFLKGFPTAPLRPDFGFAGMPTATRPAPSLMAAMQPQVIYVDQGQPASNQSGDVIIQATVNNPADAVLTGRTLAYNMRTRGY